MSVVVDTLMSQFESVQYFSGVWILSGPSHVIRLPYAFYVMGVQRATTAILDVGRESLQSNIPPVTPICYHRKRHT